MYRFHLLALSINIEGEGRQELANASTSMTGIDGSCPKHPYISLVMFFNTIIKLNFKSIPRYPFDLKELNDQYLFRRTAKVYMQPELFYFISGDSPNFSACL